MLIVTKHLRACFTRPKYHPHKLHPMWCVRDTEKGEVVFGPASIYACHEYQREKEGK